MIDEARNPIDEPVALARRVFPSRCWLMAVASLPLVLAPAALHATTALDAIKLLPKERRSRVVRIEGRDGAPEPGRWHILVSDPAAQNGLKEFVVADGAIVAERAISQFAESLTPDQMLGDGVRYNSDRAAQLAQQFALVNGVTVATIGYQLRKDAPTSIPMWRLTCLDANGREVGSLTVTATKGWVISHQGFPVEPASEREEKSREKLRTSAATQVVRDRTVQVDREPVPPPPKKAGFIQRLFGADRQAPPR